MTFVFFGTPRFAELVLDEMKAGGMIPALVVTLPDRPKGRHLAVAPSEVKAWAEREGVPVLSPERPDQELFDRVSALAPDLFVVAAYGKILPKRFLGLPKRGALNIHPSLLPKFRGPSPIESSILSGEERTGVSIMLLDEEVDHGPLLDAREVPVSPWPPKGTELRDILAREGGRLLCAAIPLWLDGKIDAKPQDHARATFTAKIEKEDGEIVLEGDPNLAYRKIHAFDAWPGAYFFVTKKDGTRMRVIVKDARYERGALTILRVVPEGKKEMDYADFLRGLRN